MPVCLNFQRRVTGYKFRQVKSRHTVIVLLMSALDDVQVGEWLAIVSTVKGSSYILQQVTFMTSGLVRTRNYTFRRDGRSFSVKQRSVTARLATESEIEAWLSGRTKPETRKRTEPKEEVILARYLASVSAEEWARLGLALLRKIRAALNERTGAI